MHNFAAYIHIRRVQPTDEKLARTRRAPYSRLRLEFVVGRVVGRGDFDSSNVESYSTRIILPGLSGGFAIPVSSVDREDLGAVIAPLELRAIS